MLYSTTNVCVFIKHKSDIYQRRTHTGDITQFLSLDHRPWAPHPSPWVNCGHSEGNLSADSKHRRASQPWLSDAEPSEMKEAKKRKQRNKKDQRLLISQRKACDSWTQRPENNCMESVLSFILLQFWMNSQGQLCPARAMEPSSPANTISELVSHWSGTLWAG